tara:strand:- start:348 stop:548 length:201 start_codon:yes stop_codon:yes gene_type:complete
MQKFKEGQKVKVIANVCGHHFEIGEIVEIIFADKNACNGVGDYKCSNGITYWFLVDKEIELTKINK